MGLADTPSTTPCGPLDLPFTDQNYQNFKAFIELMSRHDKMHGPDSILLYQPIAEVSKALPPLSYLASNVNNSKEAFDIFADLNQQGYSIHWGLNEYGYMGKLPPTRRKTHVTRARCFAVDIDEPISLPLLNKLIEIFAPTCAVISSRKAIIHEDGPYKDPLLLRHFHPETFTTEDRIGEYHYSYLYKVHLYWQVHNHYGDTRFPNQVLTEEEKVLLENWPLIQNSLAWRIDDEIAFLLGHDDDRQWTDKGILSTSRTLRVPGFFHLKDPEDPFVSYVAYANSDNVFDEQGLQTWLNHLALTPNEINSDWGRLTAWKNSKKRSSLHQVLSGPQIVGVGQSYLHGYEGAGHGGRNESLHRYACHLFFKKNSSFEEVLEACLIADEEKNDPPIADEAEINGLVTSAYNFFLESKKSPKAVGAIATMKSVGVDTDSKTVTGAAIGSSLPGQQQSPPVSYATVEERLDWNTRFSYDLASLGPTTDITSEQAIEMRLSQRYYDCLRVHPDTETRVWCPNKNVWIDGKQHTSRLVVAVAADVVQEPAVINTFTDARGQFNAAKYDAYRHTIHSERKISSIIKSFRRSATLATSATDWDAHPTFINCQNGVLDVHSGKILPQDPNYLLTQQASVLLKGDTSADIDHDMWREGIGKIKAKSAWHKFVMEICCDDIEMYYYMQKIAGYCLTGNNPEEIMFFFHGVGANGKSVFTEALAYVLGDYVTTVPASIFLTGSSDRSKILAQLPGKRLVLTGELEVGKKWSEGVIKDVTGQDEINVRPIYRASFKYRPQFKTIVRGNNKPKFGGTDFGIWRRVQIVPFNRIFYSDERDVYLREKFQSLGHKILCWAAAGYHMVQEEGMEPARVALEAQIDYRKSAMPVLAFLKEVALLEESGIAPGTLETGKRPTKQELSAEEYQQSRRGDGVYPVEFSDQIDSTALYRLYLVWHGRGSTDKLGKEEVWDACESLGIRKIQIPLIDPSSVSRELVPTWCLGLRIKPAWITKSNSGKALYGKNEGPKTMGDVIQ